MSEVQSIQEKQYSIPYHYSDLFSDYKKYISNIEYLNLIRNVIEFIPKKPDCRIVDLGCGDGRLCHEIKKKYKHVNGIDYSEKAVGFARAFNPQVKFYIQDLTVPIAIVGKFDVAIMMETLEHINPNKINKILKNVFELLEVGGILIITVPSKNMQLHKKHYQHFSYESLKKVLGNYFNISEAVGYRLNNRKMKMFKILKKISTLLFPFYNKIYFVKKFYRFVDSYYKKNIAIGNIDMALGIIAICKKNTKITSISS